LSLKVKLKVKKFFLRKTIQNYTTPNSVKLSIVMYFTQTSEFHVTCLQPIDFKNKSKDGRKLKIGQKKAIFVYLPNYIYLSYYHIYYLSWIWKPNLIPTMYLNQMCHLSACKF